MTKKIRWVPDVPDIPKVPSIPKVPDRAGWEETYYDLMCALSDLFDGAVTVVKEKLIPLFKHKNKG